jgi:hypothetical protein
MNGDLLWFYNKTLENASHDVPWEEIVGMKHTDLKSLLQRIKIPTNYKDNKQLLYTMLYTKVFLKGLMN